MTKTKLRRRALSRLIDRVVAMRQWRLAVGDGQRVELDEAVALLFVIAGDLCTRRQFIAGLSGREQLHPAADVDPGPEDGIVDKHLVHGSLQQAGMTEAFPRIDRIGLANIPE